MEHNRRFKIALPASVAVLVGVWIPQLAFANGTEILGPPSISIASGTGIVAAGTGMVNPPGEININVPAGAAVSQVLLYWEGFSNTAGGGDDTISVNGTPVSGELIGGPTEFFPNAWSTSYRTDITALAGANGWVVPGPNTLTIDGFNFSHRNDGAGILVIFDEGGTAAQIGLRDGNDLAFIDFSPPLDAVVEQTFNFAPATFARQADLAFFVGSVALNRASIIRIETGGEVTEIVNALGNTDGPEWDTVSSSVVIPANASELTLEIISGPEGGPLDPASLSWITAGLAVLPPPINGTVIIEKETLPPGGTGFSFSQNIDGSGTFMLDDGGSRTFTDVPAGRYQVQEADPAITPGGYTLSNLVCTDSDPNGDPSLVDLSSRTATVAVDPGETVICTFTNSAPTDCRMSGSEKGSLLIFPKVEIRWDASGELIQDTFIDLSNDYPDDVQVQMYFINGDPELAETPTERFHPGWNAVDVGIYLTANQPTYWSAATGLPATGGVAPFPILDPGTPPGRPDPEDPSIRLIRGYIIAWAVDSQGVEIRWNHLKGDATLVNYQAGTAWEYNAYASQILTVPHGTRSGTMGELHLDGSEYCPPYDLLLLDFYASEGDPFDFGGLLDTDLTLFPVTVDLRQETEGPVTTKASFTIWNQNEVKFTGLDLCITCWDQRKLTSYGIPNHFLRDNLQTDKGKARINGLASQLCNIDYDQGDGLQLGDDPRDRVSQAAALLGVAAKQIGLEFPPGAAQDEDRGEEEPPNSFFFRADAGTNLIGMGAEPATILADLPTAPPPSRPETQDSSARRPTPAQSLTEQDSTPR